MYASWIIEFCDNNPDKNVTLIISISCIWHYRLRTSVEIFLWSLFKTKLTSSHNQKLTSKYFFFLSLVGNFSLLTMIKKIIFYPYIKLLLTMCSNKESNIQCIWMKAFDLLDLKLYNFKTLKSKILQDNGPKRLKKGYWVPQAYRLVLGFLGLSESWPFVNQTRGRVAVITD